MALAERVTDSRTFTIKLPTAPPPEKCSIIFTVVDESGNPLEGATVNLNGDSGVTDNQGKLLFTELALKTYGWSISIAGYVTQSGQVECTETITYEIQVTLKKTTPWVIPASLIVGLILFALARARREGKGRR